MYYNRLKKKYYITIALASKPFETDLMLCHSRYIRTFVDNSCLIYETPDL